MESELASYDVRVQHISYYLRENLWWQIGDLKKAELHQAFPVQDTYIISTTKPFNETSH